MPTELTDSTIPPARSRNRRRSRRRATVPGVVIARLAALTAEGQPMVRLPAELGGAVVPARATVQLGEADVGREVVLQFDTGKLEKPILLGLLQDSPGQPAPAPATVSVDGQKIVLRACDEIVLTCGTASIVLTSAGQILIRGEYVLSRAEGVNAIKGGSVHIN